MPPVTAVAIAEGCLNPITLEEFDDIPKVFLSKEDGTVYRKEKLFSKKPSTGLWIEKEASPFVTFSYETDDEFWTGIDEETLQALEDTAHKKLANQESGGAAETEINVSRNEKAVELDRAFMTQIRAVMANKSSSPVVHELSDDSNGVTVDIKWQKGVSPRTPANNPFKRAKFENDVIPCRNTCISKSFFQMALERRSSAPFPSSSSSPSPSPSPPASSAAILSEGLSSRSIKPRRAGSMSKNRKATTKSLPSRNNSGIMKYFPKI